MSRTLPARGNAVLEMVLVMPLLLLLAFGTVEFGHYFYVRSNLAGAAREGARAAIVPSATNADVVAAIAATMNACGLQGSGYTVSTSPANVGSAAAGSPVSVTVECAWGDVGIRPLQLIGAARTLRGTAVMRKEN